MCLHFFSFILWVKGQKQEEYLCFRDGNNHSCFWGDFQPSSRCPSPCYFPSFPDFQPGSHFYQFCYCRPLTFFPSRSLPPPGPGSDPWQSLLGFLLLLFASPPGVHVFIHSFIQYQSLNADYIPGCAEASEQMGHKMLSRPSFHSGDVLVSSLRTDHDWCMPRTPLELGLTWALSWEVLCIPLC